MTCQLPKFNLPVYDPCAATFSVASDWGLHGVRDLDLVMSQPYKIVCVRPCFNEPHIFNYDPNITVDFDKFDLVIVSDIEYTSIQEIQSWLSRYNVDRYLIALGGQVDVHKFDSNRMVYRYHWASQYTLRDTFVDTNDESKPFVFDVLLGARRPHRDYVMMAMTKHHMLDSSIVTYRDCFVGNLINDQSNEFAALFAGTPLLYPYTSPNLDPRWEVRDVLTNDISYLIPVQIFRNCYYSVITETLGTGSSFFFSEKTAKAMFAKRLFLAFSNANYYDKMRKLGFESFGSVIDESFDLDPVDASRFAKAFKQMQQLATQDPTKVLAKVQAEIEHNHDHLNTMIQTTRGQMIRLLKDHTPDQHWS